MNASYSYTSFENTLLDIHVNFQHSYPENYETEPFTFFRPAGINSQQIIYLFNNDVIKYYYVSSIRLNFKFIYLKISVGISYCKIFHIKELMLLCPWNSPGNNTGVGSHSLLGSSQPKDQAQVSCTAGRFFLSKPLGKSPGTHRRIQMFVEYISEGVCKYQQKVLQIYSWIFGNIRTYDQ